MNYETCSQDIKPGDIFVALKGSYHDGHDYINEALEKGAIKAIGTKKLNIKNYKKVKDSYKYLVNKVSKQNKELSKDFTIVGITGTKGKSTTAMLTYEILSLLKINCAYIGTLGLYYDNIQEKLDNTTPDIVTINKILKKFKEKGITHIIMEVSSHSLSEKRIKGLNFAVGAFTNLSQDHLDYHQNMENYLNTKLKILKYVKGPMIINNDDKVAYMFRRKSKNNVLIGSHGDIDLLDYTLYQSSMLINFTYLYNHYTVSIPLLGKHNVYNYLEALGICISLGLNIHDIINVTNSIKPIKGRNELIKGNKGYIIIDYAHSPAAVKEILLTYNELKKNRIITIIGCGGNRDKTKRPIMGTIACENSDYVIFTSDNPRSENPMDILNDITKNLGFENYEVIENRSEAIKKGVKLLKEKDYLLILGKGHEDYQIIGNQKIHLDDKEEVLKYI